MKLPHSWKLPHAKIETTAPPPKKKLTNNKMEPAANQN